MNLLTIDDLCALLKLSRRHTMEVVVKTGGFPAPVVGQRKPRWDAAAVYRHLKCAQKANKT